MLMRAPDFEAITTIRHLKLSNMRGEMVVAFHLPDFTPVCTEMVALLNKEVFKTPLNCWAL
jgi:alkyl hydroperoxide reductase subunit AhpC